MMLAFSLLLLAATAAAQIVQFNTPDNDNITVCGQLTVTWGFDLGSLDGDTLFNLELAPADSTPTATTSYDSLTTVTPVTPPDASGSPGRRELLENISRRDGAVLTVVSPALLISQSGYTITKVTAPAGTYVLDGSVDGNADVQFVVSGSFVINDSDDESCVPPPPSTTGSTSAAATSSAPPSDSGSGSHGISAGAIAGAAIGGFLAGLGVFIAFFLLFCRRRRPAPMDTETPMTPLEGKPMRLDSSAPSTARLDSPVPPSPHMPPQQRAELAAALEAARLPGATKS